jgi:hypothetical protein
LFSMRQRRPKRPNEHQHFNSVHDWQAPRYAMGPSG